MTVNWESLAAVQGGGGHWWGGGVNAALARIEWQRINRIRRLMSVGSTRSREIGTPTHFRGCGAL